MLAQLPIHFDGTINVADVITALLVAAAGIAAWRDLNWRMKNVETWKKSHELESRASIETLDEMKNITSRLEAIAEGQDRRLRLLEKLG